MHTGPIYLVGPAGNPNFGDEFITASWLRYLAATDPLTDVWLDCPQPGLAQVLFDGLHPRLRVTNTLWRLSQDYADAPAEQLTELVAQRITALGSPAYDLGLLKLRQARSIHLLGGGYVNGNWAHHAALIHALRAVGRLTGAALFATGQGLMPALPERQRTGLFAGFSHVSVRDEASAETYGLPQGLDDAFLGLGAELRRSARSAGLYVCIQSDTADPNLFDNAVRLARREITAALARNLEVHYIECIPGADRVAYERLADLIPARRFLPFTDIWARGLPLSPQHQWITSRFHIHLLAAAAGARGIALGLKPGYYDVKHSSVAALGSGWTVALDASDHRMPEHAGTLAADAPHHIATKEAEARRLYPAPTAAGKLISHRDAAAQRVAGVLRRSAHAARLR